MMKIWAIFAFSHFNFYWKITGENTQNNILIFPPNVLQVDVLQNSGVWGSVSITDLLLRIITW